MQASGAAPSGSTTLKPPAADLQAQVEWCAVHGEPERAALELAGDGLRRRGLLAGPGSGAARTGGTANSASMLAAAGSVAMADVQGHDAAAQVEVVDVLEPGLAP